MGGWLLLIGVAGCGGSSRPTSTAKAASSQQARPAAAANYQGPLQNFQLADPTNGPRAAAEIATVMENNLSADYPPSQGNSIAASCQKQGLPNEFECPWKVQNTSQVEQLGASAAPILATGIIYVYANDRGIYDVDVPAGGDNSPAGATLPTRSISPLPAATATNSQTTIAQATTTAAGTSTTGGGIISQAGKTQVHGAEKVAVVDVAAAPDQLHPTVAQVAQCFTVDTLPAYPDWVLEYYSAVYTNRFCLPASMDGYMILHLHNSNWTIKDEFSSGVGASPCDYGHRMGIPDPVLTDLADFPCSGG